MPSSGELELGEAIRTGTCPYCSSHEDGHLGDHIRKAHGEQKLREAVLRAKEQGTPDHLIGTVFGVSYNYLQDVITEAYGVNISVLKRPKRIRSWEPKDFRAETTTVWSFKQRGNWATHDGRYRGNWSPYIPRNVILRYSRPGDVVLDYFVGGGTTAVEAKLLGRRCIARDINPAAVGLTKENLDFRPPRRLLPEHGGVIYEPEVSVGDARDLSDIPSGSIDLICAHPPYAGIIKYSSAVEGDLSKLTLEEYLRDMAQIAEESYRVLKPGGKCAILIGDARKNRRVVPIGFEVIEVFRKAGFLLRELVIKRQHNCKTTGFWYKRSLEYNFLLLAHEYLPIFEKPVSDTTREPAPDWSLPLAARSSKKRLPRTLPPDFETTTVWIFPRPRAEALIVSNLAERYLKRGNAIVQLEIGSDSQRTVVASDTDVILVKPQEPDTDPSRYTQTLANLLQDNALDLRGGMHIAIRCKDARLDGEVFPAALEVFRSLGKRRNLRIREIVILVPSDQKEREPKSAEQLLIVHEYLLIYEVVL